MDYAPPQRRRTVRTEDAIAAVEQCIEEDLNEYLRYHAQQLKLCLYTLEEILREDLMFRAHKPYLQ